MSVTFKDGCFTVPTKYQGQKLQVKLEGSAGWSDVGRILSNGQAALKGASMISKPQTIRVRIFNGDDLGSVRYGYPED